MTTVPTASMPSALERLDSKYMARIMHSFSLIWLMAKFMPRKLHPPRLEATMARIATRSRVLLLRRMGILQTVAERSPRPKMPAQP